MSIFELLLACFGIISLAGSSPTKLSEISFQKQLDTCTNIEYSNSKDCQYFLTTYQWLYDDIHFVFDKVTSENRTGGSPAEKILEKRLIHLIENPSFNLASLGSRPFYRAIQRGNFRDSDPLAIAIWPHLKKYNNHSSGLNLFISESKMDFPDLQLYSCYHEIIYLLRTERATLLKKMVADRPECFLQKENIVLEAIYEKVSVDMIELLTDHGLEITLDHLRTVQRWDEYVYGFYETFEWAILKYRSSMLLIKNSFSSNFNSLAISIWRFVKEKSNSQILFKICNNTVFDVVDTNKVGLLNMMLRDCYDVIPSHGDTLMGIAINGGRTYSSMIRCLSSYNAEITPKHIYTLHSKGLTEIIDWAILKSRVSVQTLNNLNFKYDYFKLAVDKNKLEICNKILSCNIFGIADINNVLSESQTSGITNDCIDSLKRYVKKGMEGII